MQEMISSYITCALWASNDNADESGGEPVNKNYSPDDIAPETLVRMEADCRAFVASLSGAALVEVDHNLEAAGHDFWLTRNGDGAGFWDGDWRNGDALTKASKAFGTFDFYLGDDGQIHGA